MLLKLKILVMKQNKNQVLRNLAFLFAGAVIAAAIVTVAGLNGKQTDVFF